MKNILVPCHFSDASVQAFRFAAEVAARSGGSISVLHVIETPPHESWVAPKLSFEKAFMDEVGQRAEKDFTKMRDKWATEGLQVKLHIEFGQVTRSIERAVHTFDVDL